MIYVTYNKKGVIVYRNHEMILFIPLRDRCPAELRQAVINKLNERGL